MVIKRKSKRSDDYKMVFQNDCDFKEINIVTKNGFQNIHIGNTFLWEKCVIESFEEKIVRCTCSISIRKTHLAIDCHN
tara:strand:+ start:2438 stop:2671 length:234 start_codon:yes stop_codon:yes gene_type:complete